MSAGSQGLLVTPCRLETPEELPFDALMFALQDLMVPLDAFEVAARAWRRLRR